MPSQISEGNKVFLNYFGEDETSDIAPAYEAIDDASKDYF
jgi:hypothetical protein